LFGNYGDAVELFFGRSIIGKDKENYQMLDDSGSLRGPSVFQESDLPIAVRPPRVFVGRYRQHGTRIEQGEDSFIGQIFYRCRQVG